MEHICVRKAVLGPSSGISTASAEARVDVLPRPERSVWAEDLVDRAASEARFARDARTDMRPGILMWCVSDNRGL